MTRPISASERLEAALGCIASPELEGSKAFTDVFAESARREAKASGAHILATDYVRMTRLRQAAIQSLESAMTPDDVYIMLTTPIRAPLLSAVEENAAFHEANGLVLRNPRIANQLDCPSISLPLPVTTLPVGLMLIGRRGSDRRLLEIAARVEAILAGR